jgi:hypothetical protein
MLFVLATGSGSRHSGYVAFWIGVQDRTALSVLTAQALDAMNFPHDVITTARNAPTSGL